MGIGFLICLIVYVLSALLHGFRYKIVRILTDMSALAALLSGIFFYLGDKIIFP